MANFIRSVSFSIVITTFLLSFPTSAKAFTFYDEEVDGDLSNIGLTPTQLGSLALGTNSLKATFNAGTLSPDPDYFTFTIPEGQFLEEIILKSWNTSPVFEDIAFIGMQEGDIFDFVYSSATPVAEPAAGLLGWSHLRSTQVGTNKILYEMSVSNVAPQSVGLDLIYQEEANNDPYTPEQIAQLPEGVTVDILKGNLSNLASKWAPGATGFDLPLGLGDYAIWLRQGSDTQMTIELDFNTTAVPEPITIVGTGTALLFGGFFKRKLAKKQKN